MKKATLIATAALLCAHLFVAGTVSAQPLTPRYSAGLSPNLADPHPKTWATLTPNANRLIRWEGWLDVDAFSISVLAQMQKQLGTTIDIGKYTIDEPSIAGAVAKVKKDPCTTEFEVNPALYEEGESFEGYVKLYVWTYRHNYTDKGLYQLYVSARGKMYLGRALKPVPAELVRHKDIQALGYEFGGDGSKDNPPEWQDVYADVEIWRGAVVEVSSKGEIKMVGNEAGVQVAHAVEENPMSDWERAPSLIGNKSYNPKDANGAPYWNPLDHPVKIDENLHQKRPGDAQEEGRLGTQSTTRSSYPRHRLFLFFNSCD